MPQCSGVYYCSCSVLPHPIPITSSLQMYQYPCTPLYLSLPLSNFLFKRIFMQAIKMFGHNIFPLFRCPRRHNFIRVLPCVVDSQCVPGFENFVAGNTRVGHVQMDLCMSLNSLPLRGGLVTTEAKKLPIMSPRYHLVHQRIQGCCGHIV